MNQTTAEQSGEPETSSTPLVMLGDPFGPGYRRRSPTQFHIANMNDEHDSIRKGLIAAAIGGAVGGVIGPMAAVVVCAILPPFVLLLGAADTNNTNPDTRTDGERGFERFFFSLLGSCMLAIPGYIVGAIVSAIFHGSTHQ